MGLSNIKVDDNDEPVSDESTTDSNTSSSGSAGKSRSSITASPPSNPAPSDFPIYMKKCPQHLVRDNGYGELEYITYPETPEVVLKQEWYGEPWKIDDVIDGWEWHCFTGDKFDLFCRRVEDMLGIDLQERLDNNPKRAVECIRQAANATEPVDTNRLERTCAVCGTDIHLRYDEYGEIDNQVVCTRHNVADLQHHGLI